MNQKKTLIVNLFGGPGTGKSTGATYIFSKLKMAGVDAEYVSEFAKDKVWEENPSPFKCQMYISGKQAFKISRCYGKVDVIVTDSPIANAAIYCDRDEERNLFLAILEEAGKYEDGSNFNVFLERVKEYNPNGRNQTEEEAKAIDLKILELFNDWRPFKEGGGLGCFINMRVPGNQEGYDQIVNAVLEKLGISNENK